MMIFIAKTYYKVKKSLNSALTYFTCFNKEGRHLESNSFKDQTFVSHNTLKSKQQSMIFHFNYNKENSRIFMAVRGGGRFL